MVGRIGHPIAGTCNCRLDLPADQVRFGVSVSHFVAELDRIKVCFHDFAGEEGDYGIRIVT